MTDSLRLDAPQAYSAVGVVTGRLGDLESLAGTAGSLTGTLSDPDITAGMALIASTYQTALSMLAQDLGIVAGSMQSGITVLESADAAAVVVPRVFHRHNLM